MRYIHHITTEAAGNASLSGGAWSGLLFDEESPGDFNVATIDVAGHSDEDGVLTSGTASHTVRAVASGTTAFPFLRFTLGAAAGVANNLWAQAGRGPRLEPAAFYLASGAGHIPVHFEGRFKRATLGANVGFFFGLVDDARMQSESDAGGVALTGAIGSATLMFASGGLAGRLCGGTTGRGAVGFRVAHTDVDNVIPVHLDGDEATNLTDTALTSGIAVLTADTWFKLGFRTQKIGTGSIFGIWYVNGIEVARTNINRNTFPFNQALKLRVYVYGTTATAGNIDLHWAKAVQKLAA